MDYEEAKKKLVGPVVSMPTPLKQNYELDLEGLKNNVRYLLKNGLEGKGVIMAATAGGEAPSMTVEEQKTAMKAVADVAKGKVPLVTAAQYTNVDTIVDVADYAKSVGYDCLQVSQTYYYGCSARQVYRLLEYLSKKIDIGVMVYNTPWLSGGFSIDVDLLGRLIELPNVIAVKWWDGIGPINYMEALRKYSSKVAFLDNTVNPVIGHMLGARMWLCIIGNVVPRYPVKIWGLLEEHRYLEAFEELWKLEIPWYKWIDEISAEGIRGEGVPTKATLETVGLAAGPAKPPYDQNLNEEQKRKLRDILVKAGIKVVK